MLVPRVERLERRIKELNAIKSGYRSELDDAMKRLRERKIGRDEFERIRARTEEKIGRLNEKIREARAEIQSIR